MTVAVCYKCGEFKHGALTKCDKCGTAPNNEDALAVSLVLSDHYQSKELLKKFGEYIKQTGRPPAMYPDQKAEIIKVLRQYYRSEEK